jgi:CBS domain containing-hemolysin-like protein
MSFLLDLGKISVVILLVLLNGFFVAAEFAIVKVRSTQIEPLVRSGSGRAEVAKHVISHLDTYLSACQLGITMTSLALGWVGEPFIARLLAPLLTLVGITQPGVVATISFGVGFGIITFLHIVLGELAPKSVAIQRAQQTTLAVSGPLHLFYVIFRPFIALLNASANFFLRLAGFPPATQTEMSHSEEELRLLLSSGQSISSTSKSILLRAMELRKRTVREVMVPRTDIVFLNTERTIEENLATAVENQFTRYPLCEGNLDNVLGMIHIKDLVKVKGTAESGSQLLDIRREILFVPETMPLERILTMFLGKRLLMAIAVDEYGGTAGLVTLENVLEELVGEIRDEFDTEPLEVQRVSETEYLVDGAMPLHVFARTFDILPDSREVVTVSGYAIHQAGRVPEKGASMLMGQWTATVEALDGNKVKTLRLKKSARPPEA